MNLGRRVMPLLISAVLVFSSCGRGRGRVLETAYVSAPQAFLRDRVATVYNKSGTVNNGDRVEILERDRRFARIRTAGGAEGWIEQRYLVTQQVFDGFQKLAQQAQNNPGQAAGVTRDET